MSESSFPSSFIRTPPTVAFGVEAAALLAKDLPEGVAAAPLGTKTRTGGRKGPRRR